MRIEHRKAINTALAKALAFHEAGKVEEATLYAKALLGHLFQLGIIDHESAMAALDEMLN